MKSLLYLIIIGLLASRVARGDTGSGQDVQQLPPVKVEGTLQEEAPIGPYDQPEWTTARRFATTRVYIQQLPWEVGVEQWVKAQWPRGEANNYLFQEEIELGLPYRFQADLYENWTRDSHGTINQDSVSTEVRWALADWGKIWGNPTLYGEWTFSSRDGTSDKYEFKLLLGDDLAPRWHWGANFVYEQEVGNERTTEFQFSAALGYTVIDEKLSVGLEAKIENETGKYARGPAPIEVDLGPSVQWRPVPSLHIDIVPLCGVTYYSPHVETYVIVGYDFGSVREKSPTAPVSMNGR